MESINNQTVTGLYNPFENNQKTDSQNNSQNNFGALDRNAIKEDTLEIASKAGEQIKENWLVSMVRRTFTKVTSKKFLTSMGLTIATVVGLLALGNKSSNSMAKIGHAVDEQVANSKIYKTISGGLSAAKKKIGGFLLKSDTIKEIYTTFKTKFAKPVWTFARGVGHGFRTIFNLTPPDVASKAFRTETELYGKFRNVQIELKTAKQALKALKKRSDVPPEALKKAKEAVRIAKDSLKQLISNSGCKNAGEVYSKSRGTILDSLKALVGNADTAKELAASVLGSGKLENDEFIHKLTDGIANNFDCIKTVLVDGKPQKIWDKRKLIDKLIQLQSGEAKDKFGNVVDVRKFINVVMSDGKFSPIGSWWPANFVNSAIRKITGKPTNIGRGNLFDALLKANVVDGKLADTAIGSLVQKSITVPTESVSNFVNDKSGLGFFLSLLCLKPTFDNMQEAPKGKKTATVADDLVGTIGSIAISTPLAAATTYGLATLGNLEGKTLITKILKQPGKLFNMGLKQFKDGKEVVPNVLKWADAKGIGGKTKWLFGGLKNKFKNCGGGALRFFLIMMVFNAIFARPIKKCINKIFGKPYDPSEQNKNIHNNPQVNPYIYSAPPVASGNGRVTANGDRTNLLKKWSDLPENVNSQQRMPVYAQSSQILYPQGNLTQKTANNGMVQNNTANEQIAASKLGVSEKERNSEYELYVPSIQVDNSYLLAQEQELNQRAQEILKHTDKTLKRYSKSAKI